MNQNFIVKECGFDKPLVQKIGSIYDNCIRDCHYKYFHTFGHICVYDIKLTHIGNNEIINLTISDKNMSFYELNKKFKIGGENGFIINQINKLWIKIYSILSPINIHYYVKHRIPKMHRRFFKKLSQNPDYVKTHCNDRSNSVQCACRKWYFYINSQC